MPYMERQFHAATDIQLKGLSDFTGWIKQGSYYHGVVARKGQLHKCPHLGGGSSCLSGHKLPLVSLAKSPRGERRLLEPAPVRRAKSLVQLRGPHLTYLLPWRLVEWQTAGPEQSRLRPLLVMNSVETGL